ncbi:MAG TPA: polyhydroxyalkanoic acid system family protein [Allosphingosinicella sp.]|nr:polyhydroxyalkanoic acid system family protein [Allosphingosinicella sp.]
MSGPITVDLPHRLGAEEAKRRIAANMGSLAGQLPAGAQVSSAWEGDRLKLGIGVLGQQLDAGIAVEERLVRVTVMLPPALAFFGKAIEAGLRHTGGALLEDKTKRT